MSEIVASVASLQVNPKKLRLARLYRRHATDATIDVSRGIDSGVRLSPWGVADFFGLVASPECPPVPRARSGEIRKGGIHAYSKERLRRYERIENDYTLDTPASGA